MANQPTIRINAEDGIAVVSGFTVANKGGITIQNDAASGTTARSRVLAVAAVAGSQFLAVTAVGQPVGGDEELTPIFYPESIGVAFAVGVVVGVVVTIAYNKKKKKD